MANGKRGAEFPNIRLRSFKTDSSLDLEIHGATIPDLHDFMSSVPTPGASAFPEGFHESPGDPDLHQGAGVVSTCRHSHPVPSWII